MSVLRRIANLFSRNRMDLEIADELQSHIEMRVADSIAAGMSQEAARRDALLRFGNRTKIGGHVADEDAFLALESLWSDLRYAFRQLARNPGFAFTAIAVLALGLSASTAIFAFVDAVLLKPLPYQDPSRLVGLFESTPMGPRFHLSYLDYLDWKSENKVFASLGAFDNNPYALQTPAGTVRADGATVSAGFFRTLGVRPLLGRDFRLGEDRPGAEPTVMLAYGAWVSRFGQNSKVLGQTITLDGTRYVIIGVLPREFNFAPAGPAEFWTALRLSSNPDGRGEHGLSGIARLKDGVSLQMAQSDLAAIAQQLARQYPDSDGGRGATTVPLPELMAGKLRPVLLLLLSGAGLLLLISCINVSGLLMVRAESRRHEMAIRGALGASRRRLLRHFVIEAITLVCAAACIGMCAASGAVYALSHLIPSNLLAGMPYLRQIGFNGHVVAFSFAIVLAMAVLSSAAPLTRLPLATPRDGLAEGGRSSAGTVWRHLGGRLVIAELCAAIVLLVGAGLLGKSFYRLVHTNIGFEPQHLAAVRLRAPAARYSTTTQYVALAHKVTEGMSRLPGVQSVAVAHQIPVAGVAGGNTTFEIAGRSGPGKGYEANSRQVSADYFKTIGARIERGRAFSEGDDASKPKVLIINHSFAEKYFRGEDPVGKLIRYDASQPGIEIVGVVNDIKEGPIDETAAPALYTPFMQEPDASFYVVVRTAQEPQTLLKSMSATIHQVDPEILTYDPESMPERIGQSQSAYLRRCSAWLLSGFASMALLLGVIGVYGVIAYSVSQRTREIGVRMALGAARGSVYRLVLEEAGWLAGIGISLGLVFSIGAATLMRKLLFETKIWDLPTLVSVTAILAASALLASYFPARRAAQVNPVEALRAE